jgi:sugar-specific transcriptional regulator TrmB
MSKRGARKFPELENLEYSVLLAGLIVVVAFSFVAAVLSLPIAWLLPVIFLALYMIMRILVPLRGAEPILRDFRDQIVALQRRLDALQISLGATPVEYHVDNNDFYGNLTERVINGAQREIDVTYFRNTPPTAFSQEKSRRYFGSLLEWADEENSRTVRRIIGVHTEDMRKWARRHLAETAKITNYEARIVEYDGHPQMFNMALIDHRLVYLAFSGPTNQSMSGLGIDDSRACEYFARYYDQVWAASEPLADWVSRTAGKSQ